MSNCNKCKNAEEIAEEISVEFTQSAYELHEFRHERREKRSWILNIILVFLLVATNAMWVWYESQFETVESVEEYKIIQEAEDGNNNSIINGGEVTNGETDD